MELKVVRSDLINNQIGMVMFQQDFIKHFLTDEYKDFTHTLIVSADGIVTCTVEPDPSDAQRDSLMSQLQANV